MEHVHSSWKDWVQIDQTSSEPLFLQVKDGLATWINRGLRDGTLSPGDRVPSERELVDGLGVSGITVKRALNELQQAGLINRLQGRGSFIARPGKILMGLERLYSLTTVARERGMEPARKCLELVEIAATENIAETLQLALNEPVAKLVRLRLVDDIPLALDTSYLPLKIFPGLLQEDLGRHPLYEVMTQNYQIEPIRAREYLEPTLINQYEAKILPVPVGSPAMLIARITYGHNDIPLEFNKSIVRGDMCRFYVDMLKEKL